MGEGGLRPVFVVLLLMLALALVVPTAPWSAARAAPRTPALGAAPEAAPVPRVVTPWLPNIDIIDGSSPYDWQVEPTMVINSSGAIFVGWKETTGPATAGLRVGASYSLDGGATWAPNILMEQSHPGSGCSNSDPWMARGPDDRVHYAYLEYNCPTQGLNVANTTDGQWNPVKFARGGGGLTDKDSIWVDPFGRIYAAWDEGNVMFVTWSDDGGTSWHSFVDPDDFVGGVLGVIIATDAAGKVYLVWWDYGSNDIFFDWSGDRGATWHADKRLNSVQGSAGQQGSWRIPIPAMNVDQNSGAVYAMWPDERNGDQDIYTTASFDGGGNWTANARVNDDAGSAAQWMVDLAIGPNGTVHAAWEDNRNGNWNIFYSYSTDGVTWAENQRVSGEDTPGSYERPGDYFAIETAPDGTIYVVWTDGRGADFDIFFARSTGFPSATVSFATNPAGRTILVDNRSVRPPAQYVWIVNSTHTIGAPSPQGAGATSRYVWTAWSDGGAQTHDIVASGDVTITASFQVQYRATVDLSPSGPQVFVDGVGYSGATILWWDGGSAHVLDAPSPQLVAADHRYIWTSWSDGGAANHTVTANGPFTAVATFQEERSLLLQTSPAGRSVTFDGVAYTAPASLWLPPNTDHVVSVADITAGAPGVRYVFVSWSDGGAATHVVTFTGTMVLTATFQTEYYLTVDSTVAGAGGAGWYAAGSTAQASVGTRVSDVAPGERLVFTGWSGAATGTDVISNPITMDGPKTATAVYQRQFFLNVQSAYGTVSGPGWYASGASATATVSSGLVQVSPNTRQNFTGWSGGATGVSLTSDPIAMTSPKSAVATWRAEYLVTIVSDVPGATGAGWYAAGSSATLTAPAQGTVGGQAVSFAGWSGDVSSFQATITVTVNGPKTVTASYAPAGGGPTGSPALLGGILGAVAVAAALLLVFFLLRRRRKKEPEP